MTDGKGRPLWVWQYKIWQEEIGTIMCFGIEWLHASGLVLNLNSEWEEKCVCGCLSVYVV
jgi:hypothetical protein